MRVLYVFRSLAVWGGIERILVDKMNYLVRVYGYDVYMLTTDQGAHPIPYPLEKVVYWEDMDIQFHYQYRYSCINRLIVARRMARLFKKKMSERLDAIRPDVIVCTTANYLDINILTKIKGNIPLVIESHSICSQTLNKRGWRRRYANWMYKRGLAKSDILVSLTEGDAADWRVILSCVKVIPNMVHLNEGIKSSLNLQHVIWVGRFDYQKQPFEIIKIWQIINLRHPNWHLDMYGEGEMLQEVETAVKSLDMKIHIHKPVSSIFEAYRKSSILVSTSLFEPFGLVIPEAMSCGLPVVAYDCPYGPADIISDGIDGFLVKNGDIHSFAERVCQLIEDEGLRHHIGQKGSLSSQRFRADFIMPKWINLFEGLSSFQ